MLASLDIIGVRRFIYGGDPEWERRRWIIAVSLFFGFAATVVACISAALGRLQVELAKTIVDSYSLYVMTVVPGFLGIAAWEKRAIVQSGATVQETTTSTVDPGPPATETTTTEKRVTPAKLPDAPGVPAGQAG